MSASWRYRLQVLTLSLWRRLPGWLRVSAARLLAAAWHSPRLSAGPETVLETCPRRPAVICLPIIDWHMRVQRPQHLLGGLARRGWPVVYVGKDFGRSAAGNTTSLEPGVVSLSLPGGPGASIYRGAPTPADVEGWLAVFERVRAREELEHAVVVVQWPYWTPLAVALRERWRWPVVYDCLDEHSAHPSADRTVVEVEGELVAVADLVVVSSAVLRARWAGRASGCELLPNACEFERFHHPPGNLAGRRLHGPVVGYYGALAEWFAPELLELAARRHPEWHVVLIGLNSGAALGSLARLRNAHLLGELRYAELPRWLHRFDAATIPFRVTPLTLATNPVKLFEYFAAGKPVVATALPEIEPYRHLCHLARGPEEFVAQLEAALAERDPERAAARVEIARANTWDVRVARLEVMLLEVLAAADVRSSG
jgi:glycosyltransferase involved in cell wall biosynthesis